MYRQVDMPVSRHGLYQGQVGIRVIAVRFGKNQVHEHRTGAHVGQPVNQLCVDFAIPGPAANFTQAVFIDTDDHHVLGRIIRKRLQQVVVDIAVDKGERTADCQQCTQPHHQAQHRYMLCQITTLVRAQTIAHDL